MIYRGSYKAVDERALDADSKADLQRFIDSKYSLFVDAVARGRNLSTDEVTKRWGDSRLFSGSEAVSNGLADEIGTLQGVLDSLKAGHGGRVSIDPPADNEGDPEAMKLNAQGQVLDNAGKVIGNLNELQIDAATLTKHFAAQTSEMIESAVKTAKDAAEENHKAALAAAEKERTEALNALVSAVGPVAGLAAFKAGHSVEKAKADQADALKAELAEKDKEIEALKAAASTSGKAPGFLASDSSGSITKAASASALSSPRQTDLRSSQEFFSYDRAF